MVTISKIQNDKDTIERCFFNYKANIETIQNNEIWEGVSRDNAYKICTNFYEELKGKVLELFDEFKDVIKKYEDFKDYELENNRYLEKIKNTHIEFEKEYYQKKFNHNLNKINEIKKEINFLLDSIKNKKINSRLEIIIPERNSNPITTEGTPSKWYGKDNWYAVGGNAGTGNINQCTGYAYGRFNEIAEANGTKILTKGMGNGQDFYRYGKAAGYDTSDNINDIREGDTISWAYSSYGHVAIVENINRDENGNITSIVISEGNMKGDPNSKGACHYHKKTFSGNDALTQLANRTIRKGTQSKFVGLVHQTSIS